MDQNTTNINDLPIDTNPPENRDLPERDLNMVPSRQFESQEKKVTFAQDQYQDNGRFLPEKKTLNEIKESYKIIILASLFFLLFSDLKVKSYVLNILIGIFGSSLKNTSGGISKIGLVIYSIVYGLSLFILVNIIEIATAKLS